MIRNVCALHLRYTCMHQVSIPRCVETVAVLCEGLFTETLTVAPLPPVYVKWSKSECHQDNYLDEGCVCYAIQGKGSAC